MSDSSEYEDDEETTESSESSSSSYSSESTDEDEKPIIKRSLLVYDIKCNIYSSDVNKNESEICFACGHLHIYIADTCFPEREVTKVENSICKPVYTVKYVTKRSILLGTSENVILYDLKALRQLRVFENTFEGIVWDLDVSRSTLLFVTANEYNSASIFSMKIGFITKLFEQEALIKSVKIHPNERFIATGLSDGKVVVWNFEPEPFHVRLFYNSDKAIVKLAFSTEGNVLAAADSSGKIMTWNIPQSQVTNELSPVINENMTGYGMHMTFNTTGTILAACWSHGYICTWWLKMPSCQQEVKLVDTYPCFVQFNTEYSIDIFSKERETEKKCIKIENPSISEESLSDS